MGWANLVNRVTEAAQTGASFGKGLAVGVKDGVVSMATGLKDIAVGGYNLVTDPAAQERAKKAAAAAADYGGQFIKDPATRSKAYEQAQQIVGHARDEFVAARDQAARDGILSEFYGKVAGRAGFEVGAFVVPVAKLGSATRAAEAGEALADVSKVARSGELLADAERGPVIAKCSGASSPSASRVGNVAGDPVASRLAQPGGLMATEGKQVARADGSFATTHPLAKHGPEVSDAYVYNRVDVELARRNRTGLRTAFNDRAQMEDAIAETIKMRQSDIDAWIASGQRLGVPEAFTADPGMGNLGRGYQVTTRGGPIVPIAQPMSNVNLVLIPDGRGGWLIHTAHPF